MPDVSPLDAGAAGLFGPHNLPYGVFATADDPGRGRIGVRIGDQVLDAGAAARAVGSPDAGLLGHPTLGPLLAAGRPAWRRVRAAVADWLTGAAHRDAVAPHLHPLSEVTLRLPIEVADYVDFYASEHHATNAGRLFRPDGEALPPNWKHLPIGYHGRAGTVVVSGTDVTRPSGQRKLPDDASPVFASSARLDFEAEVGFVVGAPSVWGEPVAQGAFADHVFGVCLVNDWSARDIQAWEYQPLGPFLGKSFATSVSPWVVPLDALDAARVAPPARDTPLLPYLDDADEQPWGLDLRLEIRINGHVVSRPPFATMYWTGAQMLAHMTVGGASLRTGDLYASGTVSGPRPDELGCLLELTRGGRTPLRLPDGTERGFLADGDEVSITAWAPGRDGTRVGFGEVTGRVLPAR
ncbi:MULTISPECIES: fumarylacetoacetase [Streptomycetaceae]|uniref:fumarylacetoacetase n=1 Tax=Streptantibioticus cattleyicolor (strain ATCC 35852 / DSM 46488 / JCM 4925 / NBRC 14057 / NRRL 8057) TaxID=1003195 RepID=F8JNW7_STREN|nr:MULTISPECIES: fumarylacetoacetase [Streptomycetaceae]AEW92702.1 fumarylacetoacetase [Streptantibioticus cattleyicolor NRRL 8057 = DSM 46488]MYS57470.1 fumarylacetoacetase [Streptomyces sp. SID5468]CCB73058.1 Fumarylacetoacetase [Streptantibioticus cattleyicolor NRRL 8057 = DSM 46488]